MTPPAPFPAGPGPVEEQQEAAVKDERDAWRVKWSPYRWRVTFAFCGAIAVVAGFAATWWVGLIAFVVLPAALWLMSVQDRMEWIGYAACPTCNGFGRVPASGEPQ